MAKRIYPLLFAGLFILVLAQIAFSQTPLILLDNLPQEIFGKFDLSHALPDNALQITSIQNNAVIPGNYLYPIIEWEKPGKDYDAFLINVKSGSHELNVLLKRNGWQPEGSDFEKFLKDKEVWISIYGLHQERTYRSSPVRLSISERPLKDRIAFRVVQPLFAPMLPNSIKIFSFHQKPLITLMEFEGTCVGCHGYSSQSAFFNIKTAVGRRLITTKRQGQAFQPSLQDIGEFSFMTISPDGQYAAFAVNAIGKLKLSQTSIEPFELPYESGDIGYYDAERNSVALLRGASDPKFIEDMPFFSPDGKYLLFSRYQYGVKDGIRGIPSMDLYKVPFNGGSGGEPMPVTNASANNMYQYFPRYSPNGKWISFCRGDGFQGIYARKTSDIFLLSVDGNTVTKLNLNRENVMDSWHNWSPDSHWLIFSSNREKNSLTALYLAYIDDRGKDYPPVKLVGYESLKINTPQFVPENLNLEGAKDLTDYINSVFPAPRRKPNR
jgi:hypothetical protein